MGFDDMTLPIKFNVDENDVSFTNIFNQDSINEWFWDIIDFYTYYFDTLDTTQFSAEPQTFSFGGNLITDITEGE